MHRVLKAPTFQLYQQLLPDMTRENPNIMICGTPGVGKTVHSELLARRIGFTHLSMGQIVKERGCHDGWDAEYESFIVDPREVNRGNLKLIPYG